MVLGDDLYELNPRDLKVTPLELLVTRVINTDNQILLDVTYEVPHDKILLLRRMLIITVAGAGQTCNQHVVSINKDGNTDPNTPDAFIYRQALTAGATLYGTAPIDIAVPAASNIIARGVFNSNVNANSIELSLVGTLIPRGNIAI